MLTLRMLVTFWTISNKKVISKVRGHKNNILCDMMIIAQFNSVKEQKVFFSQQVVSYYSLGTDFYEQSIENQFPVPK